MTSLVAAAPAAGILLALLGLFFTVRRLVTLVRRPALARLPVVAEQEVAIAEAGPMVLQIDGPIGTTAFAGLDVTLRDATLGRDVAIHPIVLRTRSSGFRRARLSWKRFRLEAPATLRLHVAGLSVGRDRADCAFVVVRPYGAALAVTIGGVVVSGLLLIGSIVALALTATGAR